MEQNERQFIFDDWADEQATGAWRKSSGSMDMIMDVIIKCTQNLTPEDKPYFQCWAFFAIVSTW